MQQRAFNVVSYNDKPRLRTAAELLRVTQDIESGLQEVRMAADLPLFFNSIGMMLEIISL